MEITSKSIFKIVVTVATLWMLRQLAAIIITIVFAFILVGTLNPAVRWLEKFRIKRVWAVTLVVVGCGAIVALFGLLLVPALWNQAAQMLSNIPQFQEKAAQFLSSHQLTASLVPTVKNLGAGKAATSENVAATATISFNVVEILGYAATSLVLAIYFIADHEQTRGGIYALVPRAYHVRLARVLLNIEPIVGGYMRGQLITSVAIGVFTALLLFACKIPNALALAAFASLTDVIPFVGGLLATTPAFLAAISRGPVISLVVLISMIAYQEFESRIIVPRVYGNALRLSSAMVVIALLVGGKLGGIVGALLALPLAATIRMIVEELRVDLPGDDTEDEVLRKLDEKAEHEYAKKSAGTSAVEAGAVAAEIAKGVLEKEKES